VIRQDDRGSVDDVGNRDRGCETWVRMDSMADMGEGYLMSGFQWTESKGGVDRPLDLK